MICTGISATDVRHEYGHFLQYQKIGVVKYTIGVGVPSLICFWSGVDYGTYYSLPWEYGAELYGGVMREEYKYGKYANTVHAVYWTLLSNI